MIMATTNSLVDELSIVESLVPTCRFSIIAAARDSTVSHTGFWVGSANARLVMPKNVETTIRALIKCVFSISLVFVKCIYKN